MEQRISYALGFDIAVPDPARDPMLSGGFFGLPSDVPSALRGSVAGFYAAVLLRQRVTPYRAHNSIEGEQFLAGSYDFANDAGWCFIADEGEEIGVLCGDGTLELEPVAGTDYLLLLVYDGVDTAYLYANGVLVDTLTVTFAVGPDNFGIGGTTDPSFVGALDADAFGATSVQLGGVAVGPFPGNLPDLGFTSAPSSEEYASVFSARDLVDAGPSPVPLGVTLPPASHLWSVRRGLPALVDGGNETWQDEVTGVELTRIGAQTGASVSNVDVNWAQPEPFGVEPG